MNKKQRRKIVTQNNRNRIINRRYSTTIKTLSKLFTTKIKALGRYTR
jgi:ribosomal protein S20